MTPMKSAARLSTREGAEPDGAARRNVVPNAYDRRLPPGAWDGIDTTLDASFPASDPPSWTLGSSAYAAVVTARSPRWR
jgi:hypothetical protein